MSKCHVDGNHMSWLICRSSSLCRRGMKAQHFDYFTLYLQVISSYNHPRISDLDHERHGEVDRCYKNGYYIHRDRYGWKPGQLYICTIPGGGKLKGL